VEDKRLSGTNEGKDKLTDLPSWSQYSLRNFVNAGSESRLHPRHLVCMPYDCNSSLTASRKNTRIQNSGEDQIQYF